MRRVVITGMGIVSSLGNNKNEVLDSLRHGRSGITYQPEYAERGLRSHVAGSIKNLNIEELIDRKLLRFMAKGHAYAWLAMQEAIADSKLSEELVSNVRTGLIVGAGGTSTESMKEATDTLAEKGIRRVGPYMVTKTMSSGVAACLATGAKIKGINYGISSACSTSAWPDNDLVEAIAGFCFKPFSPNTSRIASSSLTSPTGVLVPCVLM